MSPKKFAGASCALALVTLLGAASGCTPAADDHGTPAPYEAPNSGAGIAYPYSQGLPDSFVQDVPEPDAGPATGNDTGGGGSNDAGPCPDVIIGGVLVCL